MLFFLVTGPCMTVCDSMDYGRIASVLGLFFLIVGGSRRLLMLFAKGPP